MVKLYNIYERIKSDLIWSRKIGLKYLFYPRNRKRNIKHWYGRKRKVGSGFLKRRKQIRKKLRKRDGKFCVHCHRVSEGLTIDHIVKGSEGGTNDLSNLQLLCVPCHKIKDDIPKKTSKFYPFKDLL